MDIANNLFNEIDCYKSMEIFSKVLIYNKKNVTRLKILITITIKFIITI